MVAHYSFPGRWTGGRLRQAAERKTLTAGGFYNRVADCSALFRRHGAVGGATGQPIDLSISDDDGAELAAFARCHRGLAEGGIGLAALGTEPRALFDHYHAVFVENLLAVHRTDGSAIFSRPLSFVILGLVDMWKATRDERYRRALHEAVAVLLEFERPWSGPAGEACAGFVMGQHQPQPYVDCHAAALLALVRALPVLDDADLGPSIERAVNAYRLGSCSVDFGGPHRFDGVGIEAPQPDGGSQFWSGFWNYQAGLSLRAFKALRDLPHPVLRAVQARRDDRLALLETVLRFQVDRSLRDRDGAREILTSRLSGESNSETQPWVALGLVAEFGDD